MSAPWLNFLLLSVDDPVRMVTSPPELSLDCLAWLLASPVKSLIEPESPELLVPDWSTKLPLEEPSKRSPDALSAVAIKIEPLDALELNPVEISIEPP